MYRLLYLLDGVGFSIIVTFFLKGTYEEGQPLLLILLCIFTSRVLWPKDGQRYLLALIGFLLGILLGLILTDLTFNWIYYVYFLLGGFGERLYGFYVQGKRSEPIV